MRFHVYSNAYIIIQFRQGRQNRSGRSQADHDVFEGLPIRQWRRTESSVYTPSDLQSQDLKKQCPELPMPRDSVLLPEWSQQLLRAARAGRLFDPPSKTSNGAGDGNEGNKNGKTEDATHRGSQQCITVNKWSRVPRHLEEPEQDYLAKRRKGLPSLRNGIAGSLGFGSTMRRTKIRKTDSEGNSNVWQVLVPEGQAVEGEIINEEESSLAVAKPTAPGTIIEGVGAVNSDGLVVVNDELILTPPRRRPPPPKRKPKKGPGRGRKRVLFKPGEDGIEAKPRIISSEAQEAAAIDTVPTINEAQRQDKDVTMTGMPEADENEEDGEDDEDEGEVEEGEDDDDDREEGELSSSSPGQSENQTTMEFESQSGRGSVSISEAYPKPKLHPLPPAPPSAVGLPPKPMQAEASDLLPHVSLKQQNQEGSGQAGSLASVSAPIEPQSSRAQAMSRDRGTDEARQPVSLVPQHLFGASIPPAPKPQHSLSSSTKPMTLPPMPDATTESSTVTASKSSGSASSKAMNEASALPLDRIESLDRRMLSSSPDLPLAQTVSHSRNNSLHSTLPSLRQERLNRAADDGQHGQDDGKGLEMVDQASEPIFIQDGNKQSQLQTSEPNAIGKSALSAENSIEQSQMDNQPHKRGISSVDTADKSIDTDIDYRTNKLQHPTVSASQSAPDKLENRPEALIPGIDAKHMPGSVPTDMPDTSASSITPQPPKAEGSITSTTTTTIADATTASNTAENANAHEDKNLGEDALKETVEEEKAKRTEKQPLTQQERQGSQDDLKKALTDQGEQSEDQVKPRVNNSAVASTDATNTTAATAATAKSNDTIVTPATADTVTDPAGANPTSPSISTSVSGNGSGNGNGSKNGDVDLLGSLERRLNAKESK